MENSSVISRTEGYVQRTLGGEGTGHDWWHVLRVQKMALRIGEQEGADLFVVTLAALLHDIADHKFHGGDLTIGPQTACEWLQDLEVDEAIIAHVCEIIAGISFKGAGVPTPMRTIEGKVVQDADRLDALGAVGIARTFAYGGHAGREIYNPEIPPVSHGSVEAYIGNRSPTLNHFYEKLFLLRDLMNTVTGRAIAEKRHQFMEAFVVRFLAEWDGEDGLLVND